VDAASQKPLQAVVEIAEAGDPQSTYRLLTGDDGSFLVCLPVGNDYTFSVQQEGYLFFSEFFALGEVREASNPYTPQIPLMPIPKETSLVPATSVPVILRNIFFATGSADLQPASLPELQRLLQLLRDNPHLRIQINGHTDDIGTEMDNLQLSTLRAQAVLRFLTQKGIPPERLKSAGFGESKPLFPNDSPANRSRNRRTEFVVLTT